MQLIEQGKMRLDDPVSAYLPAYAHLTVKDGETVRPAKTVMTVRHLMRMQSGLNYDTETPAIEKVMKDHGQRATTRQIAEAKAEDPLEFDPGTDFRYSFSHDVLAAVIEAVSGQRFSAYLKEHIWEPLRIHGMAMRMNDELKSRLCTLYAYEPATYSLKECTMEELRIPVDGAVRAINHANMMAQEVNWPVCREAMYDFLQNSWLVMDDDDDD